MDNTVVLHLVISPWDLTDDYNRHAGALLISFLENCSVPVNIHLLYDEALSIGKQNVENINKIYFERIAERYNSHVHFHHVELPILDSYNPSSKTVDTWNSNEALSS